MSNNDKMRGRFAYTAQDAAGLVFLGGVTSDMLRQLGASPIGLRRAEETEQEAKDPLAKVEPGAP